MGFNRLPDLITDCEKGIKRAHRFLKDHGDLLPPDGANLFIPEIEETVGGAYIISQAMDDDTVTFTY